MAAGVPNPVVPPGLYDRPVLAVDPRTHTATIRSASADRDGRWAVTGSWDKTVRIWSLADGELERTIRVPAGPGNVGMVFAVAMSPDGALIAAGGCTRRTRADPQEQIYLFDRATGTLVKRIERLPNGVTSLVFSPDGNRLAAGLSRGGLRVYTRERGWNEVASDEDYGDAAYGADFAPDGRLASTSREGKVRLYPLDVTGMVRPGITVELPGKLYRIAFCPPDGARLAVGYADTPRVDVLDGHDLTRLLSSDVADVEGVYNLGAVAWSREAERLLASGVGNPGAPVLAWSQGGAGPRQLLAKTKDTVSNLVALPNGDLLAVSGTLLVRLGSDGTRRWAQQEEIANFIDSADHVTVSADGARVGFGYEFGGASPARFDMATRALTLGPGAAEGMAAPRQTGMNVENWYDNFSPTLDGKPVALDAYERSRSLAIHPSGKSFVLGTEWYLRAYDVQGAALWQRPTPSTAWAVNIAGDGRLVVAAYGDGTIRWHRMPDGACSPSCPCPIAPTGSPGLRKASTPLQPARKARCAGTSTGAGSRPTACPLRTSPAPTGPRCCRSFCRNSRRRARWASPIWRSTIVK